MRYSDSLAQRSQGTPASQPHFLWAGIRHAMPLIFHDKRMMQLVRLDLRVQRTYSCASINIQYEFGLPMSEGTTIMVAIERQTARLTRLLNAVRL